ncbi:Alpha/Beta hydrolase protein [Neurospora tetraspora]|uniref:Alpha/Beta hydrolase protein n=1 Tax=Neurospora tetraspora TaxID=94610 RepID=A0AAE0MT75_9PEZI|nr:Alpha/Beta hydrolase protein [Neurospora tetraspora]
MNEMKANGGNVKEARLIDADKNQVTPFPLHTLDHQTLYAWHILPLGLYARHESALAAQDRSGATGATGGFVSDITTTLNFALLRDDPEARLVLYFHGNAGHITQSIRPRSFHALTSVSSKIHVLAIDYRGFGLSTGSPTEEGLILDARAAVDWATKVARVPAERIVLLGHSLGTAVAAAAAEYYCCPRSTPDAGAGCRSSDDETGDDETRETREGRGRREYKPMEFAGVILVAGFSSLPTMLSGYAIAGWIPVLRPLSFWPWLLGKVMARIVDKWPSAERLTRLTKSAKTDGRRLNLTLIHARNDWDIPFHEDDKLFKGAVRGLVEAELGIGMVYGDGRDEQEYEERERVREEEEREVERCVENLLEKEKGKRTVERWMGDGRKERDRAAVTTWGDEGVVIRQELWPYGGHNNLMFYAPVPMAVMRAFGLVEQPESTRDNGTTVRRTESTMNI